MFGCFWQLGFDTAMLAMESQAVVGLRLVKLAGGGIDAHREAQRMVNEKVQAAVEATVQVATGGSVGNVVASYRRKVQANHRRLSRQRL